MAEKSEAQTIADLARAAVAFTHIRERPMAVLPAGSTLHDLEKYLTEPLRTTAAVATHDLESFARYAEAHQADNTHAMAWFDHSVPGFSIIFDAFAWRQHYVYWQLKMSPSWMAWTKSDKRQMTQVEFAEFVEENVPDIARPTGAELVGMAKAFQAKQTVNFSSGVNLATGGVELIYSDDVKASGGKGSVKIPEQFDLGIPVFYRGDRFSLTARLRYRIKEGALTIWYELVRPQVVIDAATDELVEAVGARIGLPILRGALLPQAK